VVPTRWDHSPHSDGFNELFERKLLLAAHLPQGGPTGQRALLI
jgi:hypothetical protein